MIRFAQIAVRFGIIRIVLYGPFITFDRFFNFTDLAEGNGEIEMRFVIVGFQVQRILVATDGAIEVS